MLLTKGEIEIVILYIQAQEQRKKRKKKPEIIGNPKDHIILYVDVYYILIYI